ncbi:MAG: hypothetical protein M3N91_15120 [Pseudomonadota bacterium]|nr:hypothetical protein [Pseudomonadota bacterium]
MVSDQRNVASRTDVLSFSTPVLTEASIKIFDGGSAASFVELPVVQAASK